MRPSRPLREACSATFLLLEMVGAVIWQRFALKSHQRTVTKYHAEATNLAEYSLNISILMGYFIK